MQTLYEMEDHWVFCYDNKEANLDFVAHSRNISTWEAKKGKLL